MLRRFSSLEQAGECGHCVSGTSRSKKASSYVPNCVILSGIGLYAAKLLSRSDPLNRIILVARNSEKAASAREQVVSVLPKNGKYDENIIALACDHSSLESIRAFAPTLRAKLKETYRVEKWAMNGIDVLCLNAGVLVAQDSQAEFTEDGLEVTFQTNHLAPFLITNLIHDLINPGGRVVVSTSGLHLAHKLNFDGIIDEDTGEARKGFSMMDGTKFHHKQSYAISKLCNVAFCLELNRRLRSRGVVANCFSPGLMTKSGLFRNQRSSTNLASTIHNKEVLLKEKTVQWGAGALVFMAIADAAGERGGEYWRDADSVDGPFARYGSEFCPTQVSEEDISRDEMQSLWEVSSSLAGIPSDMIRSK